MAAAVIQLEARERDNSPKPQVVSEIYDNEASPGQASTADSPTKAQNSTVSGHSRSDSSAGAGAIVIHNAWQKVFDRFDKDRSGLLDVQEVKDGLEILLGAEVPQIKFDAAMAKFDMDGSGQLDINELGQLILDLKDSRKAYVEPPNLPHAGSLLGKDKHLPGQVTVFWVYQHKIVVMFVASCIMINFFVNILEKQIDPDTENLKYKAFWYSADITLNIIFLFELIANMWSYGGPTKKFWASGWNVFDTLIVTVGVLTMVNVLGPPLDKLKLMRAFRVFRLFKRVESLNKIIVALMNSIPGVINAFVVMLVFFCIYAILAVELFRDFGEGGFYTTHNSLTGKNNTVDSVSARGMDHGIEYYGTFMRALYTLFQVMTGESWSEAVARPLIFGLYKNDAIVVGIFFVSFIILTQIVLINVVVAVLLEKFVASEPDEGEEDAAVDQRLASLDSKEASATMSEKLDNLLSKVSAVGSLASSVTELNRTVAELKFQMADLKAMQMRNASNPKGDWAHPWGLKWSAKDEASEGVLLHGVQQEEAAAASRETECTETSTGAI